MNYSIKSTISFLAILIIFLFSCTTQQQRDRIRAVTIHLDKNDSRLDKIDSIAGVTLTTASVENGYAIIDSAFTINACHTGDFCFQLPQTVDKKRLSPIDIKAAAQVKISNPSVNISTPVSFCALTEGKVKGKFVYTNINEEQYDSKKAISYSEIVYIYADGDVDIDGNFLKNVNELDSIRRIDVEHYEVSLKKGWNAICYTVLENNNDYREVSYSTRQFPADLKWVYVENNHQI